LNDFVSTEGGGGTNYIFSIQPFSTPPSYTFMIFITPKSLALSNPLLNIFTTIAPLKIPHYYHCKTLVEIGYKNILLTSVTDIE